MRADFERLYLEHRDRLFAFMVYRTRDRALAEDLLGDVFERAFRARGRFDPRRGSEATWLYSIALNRLRDHQRRMQVERAALDRIVTGETVTAGAADDAIADRDRVMRALEVLNERDRELVALRFGADLTAPQIAKVTDQPLTTVESRLFRALRRLRTVLEPAVEEPADALAVRSEHRSAPLSSSRSEGPRIQMLTPGHDSSG